MIAAGLNETFATRSDQRNCATAPTLIAALTLLLRGSI